MTFGGASVSAKAASTIFGSDPDEGGFPCTITVLGIKVGAADLQALYSDNSHQVISPEVSPNKLVNQ
jgi:hypothetical protein